jgi:hypothetical protein
LALPAFERSILRVTGENSGLRVAGTEASTP